MGATELYYFPGQKATVFLETLDSNGVRADGYTPPDGYPIITRVIFPDLTLADGFPQNMTKLDTGLYFFQFTLPTGGSSIGSYGVDVTYNVPDILTSVAIASSGNTTIAVLSNGVALPTGTINVASTVNFPTTGSIFVTTSAGVQTVTYTGKTTTTFTGCTGGTGTMSTGGTVTNTIATLPQPIINVVSTTGFPSSGSILVATSTGLQSITYTGTTGTTFTGCTGGTGIMSVGNVVNSSSKYVQKLYQIIVTAPFGNYSVTSTTG